MKCSDAKVPASQHDLGDVDEFTRTDDLVPENVMGVDRNSLLRGSAKVMYSVD
jgi:hypothetical protein